MQASIEESDRMFTSSPSLSSSLSDHFAEIGAKICEDFGAKTKLEEEEESFTRSNAEEEDEDDENEEEDDEDDDDDDFTFACAIDDDGSPISAEEMFQDGRIKPVVFPLFDQSLVFTGDLPNRPPVKKVFIEAAGSSAAGGGRIEYNKYNSAGQQQTDKSVDEEAEGPFCAWNKKAVEATPEVCKKSNSTGFSKIWRFREMSNRSNSDGRDAFVFLNQKSTQEKKAAAKESELSGGKLGNAVVVEKKKKKKTTTTISAHEVYMRSKARDEERKRSYLPYRPELVGFFTNVHGGLSKNVHHPF